MPESTQAEAATDEPVLGENDEPLTLRVIGSAIVGGIAGLVVMAPIIAGIPLLLGVFEAEPLAAFANLVIRQADATVGLAFFVGGGAFVLPLFFVVTATFLPPREPAYLRGVTIALLFWVTFVFIFWPGANLVVNASFLVLTFAAHVVYGTVLGFVMMRLTGIPHHQV
ncbi:DUF6789 family protein [Halobacterium wangiae]|uniref:DUF6789 family protein n=1 Tax=Halobacterium wangiae TaxID=2902623 RepID=UPI001E3BB1B6|nr:DUF6789 family protein [Halobacterium wangiae]